MFRRILFDTEEFFNPHSRHIYVKHYLACVGLGNVIGITLGFMTVVGLHISGKLKRS